VAVETALVLPMLCLLVIGGWILGYMAFAKVALTMTANRAARDFAAATALHDRLKETNRAYRYDGGFAESFGLPRWAVHALIMRTPAGDGRDVSDQAVVVATCYRIPLTMPPALSGGSREAAAAAPAEALGGLPDAGAPAGLDWTGLLEAAGPNYRDAWRTLQAERDEWGRLGEEARALYERLTRLTGQGRWAAELWRQALEGPPADFTPFGGATVSGPDDLERAVRQLCEPPAEAGGRALVMTGRAAYLLQTVFEP